MVLDEIRKNKLEERHQKGSKFRRENVGRAARSRIKPPGVKAPSCWPGDFKKRSSGADCSKA